jgi:meiotically up-regulated gene 157 (Mug157) protein
MKAKSLPAPLRAAIKQAADLGPQTATLVETALTRLWFDAGKPMGGGFTFISTGDIPAMWIRDSTWQVRPLLRFVEDREIAEFTESVVRTQAFYLGIDPYANAFNQTASGDCWHKDFENQSPWVFERKFELDSVTAFWQLSLDLADALESDRILDATWWQTSESLVDLLWKEANHEPESYIFFRPNNPPHDSLSNTGRGAPYANCGLIWSAFRPSDDACEMPFLIPSNIHAALLLRRLAKRCPASELAARCKSLADQIEAAIEAYAWVVRDGRRTLAYEVDGMGGAIIMDDANYPSLLSLKFLGFENHAEANAIREFVLSPANPWFFDNGRLRGIGSPHTGRGRVWPLAIAMVGLTSETRGEMVEQLRLIEETASGGAIHESFAIDNPNDFTREWFSWAEMTYFELAMTILEAK